MEFGTCPLCLDQGYVSVPNPRTVVNGRWELHETPCGSYYALAAVVCLCVAGRKILQAAERRILDNKHGAKRPMSLSYYQENICPDWQSERRRIANERVSNYQAAKD